MMYLLQALTSNNTFLEVLIWFRKEKVAVLADIQQMFHCFLVQWEHSNYHKFLWYKNNDVTKEIIDYMMKPNKQPAVAIYGLRRAKEHGTDTVKFVEHNFYVDDSLCSVPTRLKLSTG